VHDWFYGQFLSKKGQNNSSRALNNVS